jgi:hypothetical protein
MSSVDLARQQWEEGNRRLESQSANRELYVRLVQLLEVVLEELRKRVGERFTLQQLAEVYDGSDRWLKEAVEERMSSAGWIRELSVVQDAAFHRYAKGATDYVP